MAMGFSNVCWAADPPEILQVTVIGTTGRSVLIDHGRSAGVAPGQRVRFYPPGLGEVEGVIQNTSVDSARVELPPGTPLPVVGSRGEVELTPGSATPRRDEDDVNSRESQEGAVDHPPWSRKLETRGLNESLLAPGYRLRANDRKPRVDGRIFTQLNYTWDRGEDRESEFYLGRVGVSGTATNLLHNGGRLRFAGEGNVRGVNLGEGDDSSESRFRADRLSYAVGGHEYSASRGEIGRFYSQHIPELGLIDGAEGVLRFQNGLSTGIGLGAFPLPHTKRKAGEDLGAYMFVEYESESDHALTAILAYQKTWHKGDTDRDLIVGRFNVHPAKSIWLYGNVKADVHTSDDTLEDDDIEISEAWVQARFMPDRKKGATISFSHYSWPQLKRSEFQGLSDELFSDGRVDRGSVYGWYRLAEDVRVSARGNVWSDQDNSGGGGELGIDWTDIADHGTSLHGSVTYTSAAFNDGIGFRGEVRQGFKSFDLLAGYQIFRYDQSSLISGDENFVRHRARAGVNWFRANWYNSLSSDYYFGDGENAVGIMLFTSYRF